MAESHDRGYAGEQNMGFFLGKNGYVFIDGPSGAGGHKTNARGFDGIAYHPKTKNIIIYDNKAFARYGSVYGATAITKNLSINLANTIRKVSKLESNYFPYKRIVLDKLNAAYRATATPSLPWPMGVRLAISNASGRSTDISSRLSKRGIQFIDYYKVRLPPRRDAIGPLIKLFQRAGNALNDIGLERKIKQEINNHFPEIINILLDGFGVLVVIGIFEKKLEGSRASQVYSVNFQRGCSFQGAKQAWLNPSVATIRQGPPAKTDGVMHRSYYTFPYWIPPP